MSKRSRVKQRGHIRPQGKDSWAVIIRVPDPITGKTKPKWHTVRGTEEDANAKLTELLYKLDQGEFSGTTRMTVRSLIDEWLEEYVEPELRPTTRENYKMVANKHLLPVFGDRRLDELNTKSLRRFFVGQLSQYAANTVKKHQNVMKSIVGWAVKNGYISESPMAGISAPRKEEKEFDVLSEKEVSAYIRAAENNGTVGRSVLLALLCGLRRGEVLGLQKRDVDFGRGSILVRQSLRVVAGEVTLGPPKTASSKRQVPLPSRLSATLERDLAGQPKKYHVVGNSAGGVINPGTLHYHYTAWLKENGLRPVTFHELRHTFATHLLSRQSKVRVVSRLLGHADPAVTLRTYDHVMPSDYDHVSQVLDSLSGVLDEDEV